MHVHMYTQVNCVLCNFYYPHANYIIYYTVHNLLCTWYNDRYIDLITLFSKEMYCVLVVCKDAE